jgi:hypothetical protein
MFSSAPPRKENAPNLLVTGGFGYDFTGSQAAFSLHFQDQKHRSRASDEGY